MKTLEIGGKVEADYYATFVCEIETMLGDGDDDETVVVPLRSLDDLDEFEGLLDRMRKSGDRDYSKIPGFKKYFCTYQMDDDPEVGETAVEWPFESDYDAYYTCRWHQYFWYDESGVKYQAKLATKKPRKNS